MEDNLPEKDRNRINADHDETLIEPIAEILYQDDRAWYTKDQINIYLNERYNQDVSNPTIASRLDDLLEIEIIKRKRIGPTDIFYYNADESEWPLPPDTVVESKDDDMTVSELFDKTYVWWAGSAIVAVLIGGIIVWAGTLQASNILPLPVNNTDVLAVGLLTFLCSYLLLLVSVLVGILDMVVDKDLPEILR